MRMEKLKKKLAEAVDMPESSFGACPYLTVEGNGLIRMDECLEILAYDEEEIRVRLRGLTVTVTGEAMTMRSYAAKTIRISGVIRNIALSDEL